MARLLRMLAPLLPVLLRMGGGAVPWRRICIVGMSVAVGIVFGLVGVGFLLAALYLALEPLWGPALAAAAIGGGLIVLVVLGISIALLATRRSRRSKRPSGPDPLLAGIASVEEWVGRNPLSAVAGAMAAGAMMAQMDKR